MLGAVLLGVAYLAASFSPRQPKTVTLDVGFSGIRISLVLLALVWVQEFVAREIERKSVFYAFAAPVSRAAYLVGRYFGIIGLLGVAASIFAMLLWWLVGFSGGEYRQAFGVALGYPYLISILGLWFDACVVAAVALWVATLSTVPMLPMLVGGFFAIAGKALGAAMEYLANGADGDVALVDRMGPWINVIRYLLPDLSRLDFRIWALYGVSPAEGSIALALMLAVSYVLVMLLAACAGFVRREFF